MLRIQIAKVRSAFEGKQILQQGKEVRERERDGEVGRRQEAEGEKKLK